VTGPVPDAGTDPAGYLLAMADRAEAEAARLSVGESKRNFGRAEDDEWLVNLLLAQAALWRAIGKRQSMGYAVLMKAVAAAQAYQGGQ
jgi:hypothetical protein